MFESIEDFYFEYACQFFQIVGDAKGRLTVLELSFADEEDFDAQLNRPIAPLESVEKYDCYEATKRRLNSRCKAFLEILAWITKDDLAEQEQINTIMASRDIEASSINAQSSNASDVDIQSTDVLPSSPADVKVSYLHRTARDFLHSPGLKQQVQMGVKKAFYPYFPLFRSSILSLKTFEGPMDQNNSPRLWEYIKSSFEYAAKCESWSNVPRTYLLQKLDEIVTVVSMNGTPISRSQQGLISEINDNSHWTATSRESDGSTGFADLATKYDVPLYIMQTIKTSLKETGDGDPDIHRCLFNLVRDFQKYAGVCEWVGCPVPRLSFVNFLLERGADPNKYYNSVTAFKVVLSEAVNVSLNDIITEKERCLEHWALLIEEFIKHNGNPKANGNSAVGSLIREAFGKILPERARHLERLTKRSSKRWFSARKYLVPPLIGRSSEVDQIPIRLSNKLERSGGPKPYLTESYPIPKPAVDSQQTPPSEVFPHSKPDYSQHCGEPLVPCSEFRLPEDLRVSNRAVSDISEAPWQTGRELHESDLAPPP